MFVFVNVIHEFGEKPWYELADNDTIDGLTPSVFAEKFMNETKHKDFYEVIIINSKDNQVFKKYYYIHNSCIQLNKVIKLS